MWYVHYDIWITMRNCFISTPTLTRLWDDTLNAYAAGDNELFMEMHWQIAQYMPDHFGPCMENATVATVINKLLGVLENFASLEGYAEIFEQNY